MPKAYKLLRIKDGKLYPLYVNTNEETTIGVWLKAKAGERTKNGKVKSKLGPLAFRPGWHLSPLPKATHIGVKEDGEIRYMHPDTVWCECRYHDCVSYQGEANANGWKNGKFSTKRAMLTHIPENGFYHYKTNPAMFSDWIIAGEMKLIRILSDDEVAQICRENGEEPQPRLPE